MKFLAEVPDKAKLQKKYRSLKSEQLQGNLKLKRKDKTQSSFCLHFVVNERNLEKLMAELFSREWREPFPLWLQLGCSALQEVVASKGATFESTAGSTAGLDALPWLAETLRGNRCVCFYIYGLVIRMFKTLIKFLASSTFIEPASHTVPTTAKKLWMRENCTRPYDFYFALLQAVFCVEVNRKAKVSNTQSPYIP